VERPFGLFHPRESLHHIKKENIGLIEVMGLAILPARLKAELEALRDCLLNGRDPTENPQTAVHAAWAHEIAEKHPGLNATDIDAVLQTEVGLVFKRVLEDAGVFKAGAQGDKFLNDFIKTL
jgi:UDPglucose--hexose-1-phosphate uridylyltransferase